MDNLFKNKPEDLNMNDYYTIMYAETPVEVKRAITIILLELKHAEHKHPDPWAINTKSGKYDHCYAAAIVSEEAGELLQAAMQQEHEGKDRGSEMLTEASQTGATVVRFIINNLRNNL